MRICLLLTLGLALGCHTPGLADTNPPATTATRPLTELFGDPVVAKGDGFEIRRSQLDAAVINFKAAAAARGVVFTSEQMRQLEPQLLQNLIQIQIMLTRATEADRARGREQARTNFDLILQRLGSEEALQRQLKAVGMTRQELIERMSDESTAGVVLEREMDVTISDEQARKFYDENPANFEVPEQVHVSQILLSTRDPQTGAPLPEEQRLAKLKLAQELLKRARDGEDFAKLARQYSEDLRSRDRGGEYTFPRGVMVTEFESAAFSLNTNQISDIVTTSFGYHIIKLWEKIPARKLAFDEVREDLKQALKRQEMQKRLPEMLERLKREQHVVILDEKLKLPEPACTPNPAPGPRTSTNTPPAATR